MKFNLMLSLILSLFVFGCSQNTSSSSEQAGLTLNNGAKWKVNPDMMVHVRTAEKAIESFETTGDKDFQGLSETLDENINKLTSSCTMQGQAHDELHKWLLPYIALVDDLSDQETEQEGQKSFQKIQGSFQEFNQYFQ